IDRWEPGAFIQASAFDNYVAGRPSIAQLKLVFLADPNAAVAALLAGDVDAAVDSAISFEQGAVLSKQWASSGAGEVVLTQSQARFLQVQFKSDYVNPRAVLDLRVRKALLEATDRAGLSAAMLDGQVAVADTLDGPQEPYFAELGNVLTKYAYNLADAQALMAAAGFTRGAGGRLADAAGQPLSLELRAFTTSPGPSEAAVLADQWKVLGLETTIHIIPAAQEQDLVQVSTYPALRIEQSVFPGTPKMASSQIATEANRWAGSNRGGYRNPEFDRLYDVVVRSFDRTARDQATIQALKFASDDLPILPLYYLSLAAAHTATLEGMHGGSSNDTAWDNVSQWHWTS
ncbi:MAG: peptide/nickel transport system substrate-binding protein, partial [Chloroflexota bacterium]|nr:peptide/nickel transport system substrate-binding protein [Chloroflexota bacterium]